MNQASFAKMLQGAMLNVFLHIAYFIMRLTLSNRSEESSVAPKIEDPPANPVASLNLAMALDERTSPEKLETLSQDADPIIRRAISRNPKLSLERVRQLASDPDPMVAEEAIRVLAERETVSVT